jgi:glycosyltransferase involved in cell wall biosynthesis
MCAALIDAMAASKPAVATDAGAIAEVLVDGETGFLVPPRDHAAMAARLVMLLKDDGLRTRMGDAALARVRATFTVERMVAAIAAVYARLAGTRRAADTASLSARG